jgi:glycosyltransferase involved in cell wall biosynthesis
MLSELDPAAPATSGSIAGEQPPENLPRITVGVTTYNRPGLLRECVESILRQTYPHFEILIGNDYVPGPVTFESLGIPPDPRIKIVNHPQNIGAYQNNYYLIKNAGGDWFTWLADDDLMHPRFLEYAHEALSGSEALSFFCSYAAAADPKGVFPIENEPHGELSLMPGDDFIEEYAARRIRAVGAYGVFKRQTWEAIYSTPRFGSGLAVYVDTFIPVVVATLGPVAYRNFDLVFLRTHAGSQSATLNQLEEYASAQGDFLAEFRKTCRRVSRDRFELCATGFLWWFVQDGWHVAWRSTENGLRRLISFLIYFFNSIQPALPRRHAALFYVRAGKMVFGSATRQFISKIVRRTPSPADSSSHS